MKPPSPDAITNLMPRGPKLTLAGVDLAVVDGPDRGLRHRITSGKVRVGTGAGVEVKLSDPTVSRLHCEIDVLPRGVRVIDLGSTNGIVASGVRIRDAELLGGGTLTMGATVLRLDVGGEALQLDLSPLDRFGSVIGGSAEMRRIYAILDRVAPTDATVLIQGETGTGKEAVARAVHEASRRADGPFVAIDCGAIAESLVESELFGHVRGAFSGAVQERRGLFEEADKGTLFLDEIGELPLSLQPKLLRALELREVRRVGSNTARKVDVRLLAATNRPLAQAVNEGTFREDLYYRLAVIEVGLPPLRARREDIPMLASQFYRIVSGSTEALPAHFVSTLLSRAWPGNVRELRNFVERAVALGWREQVAALPANARGGPEAPPALEALVPEGPLKEARARWTEHFELLYLRALLKRAHGNVTRAAELAQINRRSLQRMMVDHGIRSGDEGRPGEADEDALGDEDLEEIDEAP